MSVLTTEHVSCGACLYVLHFIEANMKNTNPHFRNDRSYVCCCETGPPFSVLTQNLTVYCRYTLEQSIGALDGLDLLDLATGDGYYARHFKRRGAKRVLGVDLSLDMVTLAKAAESKEPLGITYETGDCKSLTKLGVREAPSHLSHPLGLS